MLKYNPFTNTFDYFEPNINTFGDISGGDYSEFESDGTLKFVGEATIWNDANIGSAQLSLPAVSFPSEAQFVDNTGTNTGIYTLAFSVGDKVSGEVEIPHSYKEGSDYYFHVHWQGIAAPTGTEKVQWQLDYAIGKKDTTLAPKSTITIETDFDTQYSFVISAFAAISGSGIKIGDQFLFTLTRIAASVSEYSGAALIATVGIHYEADTVGSRNIATK